MRFESQLSRMNCQMVFLRVEFGTFGGQHLAGNAMSVMLAGDVQSAGETPSGLIDEDRGARAGRDLGGDLGQLKVHRLGVATRRDEGCAFFLRTDRAENVGRGGPLISGSAGAVASACPSSGPMRRLGLRGEGLERLGWGFVAKGLVESVVIETMGEGVDSAAWLGRQEFRAGTKAPSGKARPEARLKGAGLPRHQMSPPPFGRAIANTLSTIA